MNLLEFFYYNDNNEQQDDLRYSSENDSSVLKSTDTRKMRLTLKDINHLRRTSEAHEFERENDLKAVKHMYGQKPATE